MIFSDSWHWESSVVNSVGEAHGRIVRDMCRQNLKWNCEGCKRRGFSCTQTYSRLRIHRRSLDPSSSAFEHNHSLLRLFKRYLWISTINRSFEKLMRTFFRFFYWKDGIFADYNSTSSLIVGNCQCWILFKNSVIKQHR